MMTLLFSYTFLVLNGPNLNLLGVREPELYGHETLESLEASMQQALKGYGLQQQVTVRWQQSNHEGALVEAIHAARLSTQGLIINPAAYGHTSIALRDALASYEPMAIEVHLSNIFKREAFRHHTYTSSVVQGCLCGFGALGYQLALQGLLHHHGLMPSGFNGLPAP
jgi:3-dehydroquinate dehydratase II